MGRLSFAIALNLITDGFRKGANEVKGAFSSMQAKILTFSAGFDLIRSALAGFSAQVLDIVRDTNRASTALKNVSGSAAEFAGNQRFLIDLSKKYGANVNDMSTAYAKFTAAAKLAGMPLSIQKSLFESVSRATAAFALSSEDTNSVFLALSQMMGKGKVQAQELRLQMGEKLPVALQAMAKAAGVSVGQLDDMMQKGELLSGKVLPKFGKALDELIPNVDTNHLETSVNKFQNAKTELLKSTPVSDTYKLFIDTLTEAVSGLTSALNSTGMQNFFSKFKTSVTDFVDYVKNSASSLISKLVGLFAGIKLGQFYNQWKAFDKASSEAMVTNATVAHSKVRMLESGTARLKRQIAAEETNIDKLSGDERLAAEVQITAKKKQLAATELALTKAKNTAKVTDERAAAVLSGNAWEATWAKIKTGAASVGASLKAMWATAGPMILITLITEIIAKFADMMHSEKEISAIWSDYKRGAKEATHTQEIEQLKQLQTIYNKTLAGTKERKTVLGQINSVLGTQLTNEKDINRVISERIKLLGATAAVNYYTQKKLDAQNSIDELEMKYGGQAGLKKRMGNIGSYSNPFSVIGSFMKSLVTDNNDINLRADAEKIDQYKRIISNASTNLTQWSDYVAKHGTTETPWSPAADGTGKTKKDPAKTELENAEQKYAEEMMKIALSEKKGLISSEAATEARQKLVVDLYSELATSKYPKVRNSDFTKKLSGQYAQIENDKPLEGIKKVAKDFEDKQRELTQQYNSGAITQEEYNKGVYDSTVEAKKAAAAFMDISSTSPKFLDVLSDLATSLSTRVSSIKQTLPTEAKRDTTFDYKKTNTDILGEQVENAKKQLEDLKSMAVQGTEQMVNAINAQLGKVTSLSNALKLAEVKDDIKNLKKELSMGQAWEDFKGVAGTVQDIGSAFQNLSQTMSNADASSWEKILSIWQAIQSSVDGILNVIDMVKRWTVASNALSDAEAAKDAIISASTTQQIADKAALSAATETASVINVASAAAEESAWSADAAASTFAAHAYIPFVGTEIASGFIAQQQATIALAAIPKFATGGIISGGSTSGDNMLARVNSGEMILNGGQQRRLFNIANGNGGGTQQQSIVSTKVRGEDMYLTIKNFMKSKNKKW